VSVIEKSEVLSLVAGSGLPRRRALAQLGLAKSLSKNPPNHMEKQQKRSPPSLTFFAPLAKSWG